ncbi:DNA/RNA polymerases superfamily protein [Gossypium australe]|uniref:DNA/RNA polymerases superfamily protein n=1 Tax=Gossypium australe TaxID=47621 RepID=A0A5B6VN93_9ROSI|nr:DNA/RNA polymerases superfamily protein [Gossypium australe]
MDFVSGLSLTPTKLTKLAHFLSVHINYSLQKLVRLYISEIVRLLGVPKLHETLGTRLDFSTTFHPQFDGWEEHFPLAKLAYNNSFQSSIQMAPYEALQIESDIGSIEVLCKFEVEGYRVQCQGSISLWKKVLRFGQKGKLSPRFIGPYRILKRIGLVAYQLELPPKMNCIHDVYHVSMLRRYQSDPSHVVPIEEIKVIQDLSFKEESVQILEREVMVLRKKWISLVKVLWRNHGTEEAPWIQMTQFVNNTPISYNPIRLDLR